MARLTLGEMFNEVRAYLDTDDLNFTDDLLSSLLRRVWYQAVAMEKEWAFLHQEGDLAITAGLRDTPAVISVGGVLRPSVRIFEMRDENGGVIPWTDKQRAQLVHGDGRGEPCSWSDHYEGGTRLLRLYPVPVRDRTFTCEFYAEAVFPPYPDGAFIDLPEEFDEVLKEGLVAEMYMREEDPDLYQAHRSVFLEQMGSIRAHWRGSVTPTLVMNGRARSSHPSMARPRNTGSGW